MKRSIEQIQIEHLSKKRLVLFKKYQDSYDEELADFTMEYPKEIDTMSDEILDRLKAWRHSIPFEFIIEELTNLGWAPCLLYDDDGHFAISGEGMQSISIDGPDDCQLSHFIEKDMWKDTIREALNYYLDSDEE